MGLNHGSPGYEGRQLLDVSGGPENKTLRKGHFTPSLSLPPPPPPPQSKPTPASHNVTLCHH